MKKILVALLFSAIASADTWVELSPFSCISRKNRVAHSHGHPSISFYSCSPQEKKPQLNAAIFNGIRYGFAESRHEATERSRIFGGIFLAPDDVRYKWIFNEYEHALGQKKH